MDNGTVLEYMERHAGQGGMDLRMVRLHCFALIFINVLKYQRSLGARNTSWSQIPP